MTDLSAARRAFDALCDLPVDERAEALAALAQRDPGLADHVRGLLAADSTRSGLDSGVQPLLLDSLPDPPFQVGDFRALRVLGSGGMGVVYEAEQAAPRRRVALKVIRPGLLTEAHVRRFEQEAQALAWLDHPCIARVLASGTAETSAGLRPFIAMELVAGLPLDRYAEEQRLDVRARLGLVVELCGALHHAHQRGVVHRDLKPANIVVTPEGRPKVLDFGVARLERRAEDSGATGLGELLGTLPYMSPEQVAGDPAAIDLRADVYALGALTFELLAGRLPLDVRRTGLAEAARAIAERVPPRLGRLRKELRGDVECIVAKALEKDPDQRYPTALALGEDLERHLDGRSIHARPVGRLEQVRRFARREPAIAGAVVAVLVALAVTVWVTQSALLRTSRSLAERDAEVRAAEEAIGFLEGLFAEADPLRGKDLRLSEMALAAAKRFEGALLDRPLQRARLQSSIGKVLNDLGLAAEARPLLLEAAESRRKLLGERSLPLAEVLERLAYSELKLGQVERGLELQREVLAIRRALDPSHPLVVDALVNLAGTWSTAGGGDAADALSREAVALATELYGRSAPKMLAATLGRARVCIQLGRYDEAVELARAALPEADASGIPDLRISARSALGWALRLQRRAMEAEPLVREAIELAEQRYAGEWALLRELHGLLGGILSETGRAAEAVADLRALYARVIAIAGPKSLDSAHVAHDLAFAVHELPPPENAEAEALYRAAAEAFLELLGEVSAPRAQVLHNWAAFLTAQERLAEALPMAREALDQRTALLGEGDPNTLSSLRSWGSICERLGQLQDAEGAYRMYVILAGARLGERMTDVQRARIVHARILRKLGRTTEARAILDDVEATFQDDRQREALAGWLQRQREALAAETRRE